MGSIHIQNFKYGMDRRRERMAGVPGTLWTGENVHISRGGDVERPKSFVRTHTLPTGLTKGLAAVRGQLYAFGAGATPSMPVGVAYQRLVSNNSAVLDKILDVKTFDGKLYVVARFVDGHICHFYNGTRVTHWETLADAAATYTTLADYFAELINADDDVVATPSGTTVTLTAKVAGTAFTLATATVNGSSTNDQVADVDPLQVNVAAVDEVQATGTVTVTGGSLGALNKFTSVTVDGVELLTDEVSWLTSNTVTAALLSTEINNGTATHGYSATSAGAVVTISAPVGEGSAANGLVVAASVSGNVTASTSNMAGGVTEVEAVAQVSRISFGGTVEALDKFTITVNNRAYVATPRASAMGVSAFVHKKRMWSPANSLWRYSKLNDPSDWTDGNASTGAGFINVSSDSEGTERLVAAAAYGTQAAVFSRRNAWIYNLSTDAADFAFSQPIENTGTMAVRSPVGYGNLDVFYLDDSGVRSLRAKENTDTAYADDIGSPIDPFIREYMDSLSDGEVRQAVSAIEPRDRRYWLAIGERIFVLSYFPKSQISAWTYYDPGFSISDIVRAGSLIYLRSGDFIYTYGGATGATEPEEDELVAEVELPFAAASPPRKVGASGFDMAAVGNWDTYILPDPNNEASEHHVGVISGCSYPRGDISANFETSHFAFRFTCSDAGQAKISNLTLWTKGKLAEE